MTGLGVPQIVLRKVDGAEILRRDRAVRRHRACARRPRSPRRCWRPPRTGRARSPGGTRSGSSWPALRRPRRRSSGSQEELGWEFIQIYGLTETSPLLTINRGPGRVGRPHRGGARRPAGPRRRTRARRTPAGLGDDDPQGEVLARSNVVLEGYWEQPEETERRCGTAGSTPGTAASIGDDGYLTISDRKKDVIITGGENVSSIEVEDVLFSHPAVAEVAVIGVPSEKWGETIKALVVAGRRREGHRGRADRLVQGQGGRLQGADVDRVPRRARPHRDRQAPEVQAARSPTGRATTARSTEPRHGPHWLWQRLPVACRRSRLPSRHDHDIARHSRLRAGCPPAFAHAASATGRLLLLSGQTGQDASGAVVDGAWLPSSSRHCSTSDRPSGPVGATSRTWCGSASTSSTGTPRSSRSSWPVAERPSPRCPACHGRR